MATILLVEDDTSMRLLTTAKLKHRYAIISVQDGVEALDVLERHPVDLIIADVMMPSNGRLYPGKDPAGSGGTRSRCSCSPPKQSFEDKREGFSSGVDDYMTKPVNYEELIWRLDALLRRAHIASEHRIVVGRTVLDSGTYTVTRERAAMELPKKEFELLYKLLSYPGQIFSPKPAAGRGLGL